MTRLAIIGAGPKAAAVCARGFVRNAMGGQFAIDVFEAGEPGSNWNGSQGYTDGKQELCTPNHRDLGYPYVPEDAVDMNLWEEFSWARFEDPNAEFATPPQPQDEQFSTHLDLAKYVAWALEKACQGDNINLHSSSKVVELRYTEGSWTLTVEGNDGNGKFANYDGVMVTGPGPASRRATSFASEQARLDCENRVVDSVSYWSERTKIFKDIRDRPQWTQAADGHRGEEWHPILIAGAGGTAAAIAADIVTNLDAVPVFLISSNATLFTRGNSAFENLLFETPDEWKKIPVHWRQEFIGRTVRGIVWPRIMKIIGPANSLKFFPGRVKHIESWDYSEFSTDPTSGDAVTQTRKFPRFVLENEENELPPASWLVDATGFDAWWFQELLPESLKFTIVHGDAQVERQLREILRHNIHDDLSLPPPFPARRLHVPMLADLCCGPHCSNLLSLGLMSRSVIDSYG